jgi:hypothetical protein
MTYGYVWLPPDFVFLLQSDMQATGYGFQYLKKTLWNKPQFQSVYLRATRDLDLGTGFEKAINSLGWLGVRDRMCSLYLHHQRTGHYPNSTNLDNIKDILKFEEAVALKTTQGHSRAYLLAFYLSMEQHHHKGNVHPVSELNRFIDKNMKELLLGIKTKTMDIDWLLLSLHYFLKFLDADRVKKLVLTNGNFMALRETLTKQQQYEFYRAMLSYGASIQNGEHFCGVRV